MIRCAAVLLLATIAGCGSKTSAIAPTGPVPQVEHGIPDAPDRCPILVDCHEAFVDSDGCPDPVIVFPADSAVPDSRSIELVRELAHEISVTPTLAHLRLRGHRTAAENEPIAIERAQAARRLLIERGVSPRLLSTADAVAVTDAGYVTLEVIDCASGSAEAPDPSAARFIILM